jgi:6-pyruvoyltetrahydropterin/6-carboxytetrahydropterin synthase
MAKISVTRQYSFEAGHWLPKVPEKHKCKRPHGHNYVFEVIVHAIERMDGVSYLNEAGFVIDFWDLDVIVQPLIDMIDHRMLNDIKGLENPTAENIALWFLQRISIASSIRVYETPRCWADVRRDDR